MEEAGGGAVVDEVVEEDVVEEITVPIVDAERDDKAVAGRTERMELTDVVAGGLEEEDRSAEYVGVSRDEEADEVADVERLEETWVAGDGDEDDGTDEDPASESEAVCVGLDASHEPSGSLQSTLRE